MLLPAFIPLDAVTIPLTPHGRIQAACTPDGRHLVTANGTVYVLRLEEWGAAVGD